MLRLQSLAWMTRFDPGDNVSRRVGAPSQARKDSNKFKLKQIQIQVKHSDVVHFDPVVTTSPGPLTGSPSNPGGARRLRSASAVCPRCGRCFSGAPPGGARRRGGPGVRGRPHELFGVPIQGPEPTPRNQVPRRPGAALRVVGVGR